MAAENGLNLASGLVLYPTLHGGDKDTTRGLIVAVKYRVAILTLRLWIRTQGRHPLGGYFWPCYTSRLLLLATASARPGLLPGKYAHSLAVKYKVSWYMALPGVTQ